MLHLLVRLGKDTYAIETACVRRLLPMAQLQSLSSGLAEVAGVLNFHGTAVPVLDLTLLLTGRPSRQVFGTRIVLADVSHVDLAGGTPRLLGLLAEGAHSVTRLDPSDFQPAGVRPDGRPWLGPVAKHGHLLVQRIEIAALLTREVLDALQRDSQALLVA